MKEYKFKCIGMMHYEKAIKKLERTNPDYSLTNSELVEQYPDGERVFQKEYIVNTLSLEPEPDNPFDEKAIKVVADGNHIAYVKSGSCTRVKNLLASPSLRGVSIEIGGGKFKQVYEDEDEDGDVTLKVRRDEAPTWAHLTFFIDDKAKKFCTQCGKPVVRGSKFCIYCGSKL